MADFFDFIINAVSNVVNFISNMVESVVSLFQQLTNAYAYVNTVVTYLPPFCQAGIMTILAISVLAIVLSLFIDLS